MGVERGLVGILLVDDVRLWVGAGSDQRVQEAPRLSGSHLVPEGGEQCLECGLVAGLHRMIFPPTIALLLDTSTDDLAAIILRTMRNCTSPDRGSARPPWTLLTYLTRPVAASPPAWHPIHSHPTS